MVGIGQIGLEIGFMVARQGELEDRLELGFDRIDQSVDPLLGRGCGPGRIAAINALCVCSSSSRSRATRAGASSVAPGSSP